MTNLECFVVRVQAACNADNSFNSGTGVICLSASEKFDCVLTAAHCLLGLTKYDEENNTYQYAYSLEEIDQFEIQIVRPDGTINRCFQVNKENILILKEKDFALLLCDKEVSRVAGLKESLVFADGLKYLNEVTLLGFPHFASGSLVSFNCTIGDNYDTYFSIHCPDLKEGVVQNFKGISGSGCFYKDFPVYYGCVSRTMGNHNIATGRILVNRITAEDVNGLLRQYFKNEDFPVVVAVSAANCKHLQILQEHTRLLLKAIHTAIPFQGEFVEVDRIKELNEIGSCLSGGKHVMIIGEGGCGKTALIKRIYEKIKIPFYMVKAVELGAGTLEKIYGTGLEAGQLIDYHRSYLRKVMVIDSAERLFENSEQAFIVDFIKSLADAGWQFIFTTRKAYLSVLEYQVKKSIRLDCEEIIIDNMTAGKLEELAGKFHFDLPEDFKLRDRLRNPFYLNEYLNLYTGEVQRETYKGFMEMLWHKKIMNSGCTVADIHKKRERNFLKYVEIAAESNDFYLNADRLESFQVDFEAIGELVKDDVLEYDEQKDAYFIAHDIYEEWALGRIIERAYFQDSGTMFKKIGTSLSVRRAFRAWLTETLTEEKENRLRYVDACLADPVLVKEWKDEILITILRSEYAEHYFDRFEKQLKANDFQLFYDTVLHWLKTACLEPDKTALLYTREHPQLFLKPYGSGWESAIHFIFSHIEETSVGDFLSKLLPLLEKWTEFHKTGIAAREAAISMLLIYERKCQEDTICLKVDEEKIAKVLANASGEIREELKEIVKRIIQNRWCEWSSPYYELFSKILAEPLKFGTIFQTIPAALLSLCELYWRTHDEENMYTYKQEAEFNLSDRYEFKYFPPSAFHSPVYFMLKSDWQNTLDFMIRFVNESVEYYATHSGREEVECLELSIDEKTGVRQYCNFDLWRAYRGGSNVPDLLESMHMALERCLLEYAEITAGNVEEWLLYILSHSKSASLSAIVASVVCAHPEYFRVAAILFGQLEFILLDNTRLVTESTVSTMTVTGLNPIYDYERKEENQRQHRNRSLENLFVQYEFFSAVSEEETQIRQVKLYEILDRHKLNIEKEQTGDREKILLARLDRRGMKPEIKKQGDQVVIELNPALGEEQRRRSEEVMKEHMASMRYMRAGHWAYAKYTGSSDYQKFPEFENNPALLSEHLRGMLGMAQGNDKEKADYKIYYQEKPAFICYFLLKDFREQLNNNDLQLCKQVLLNYLTQLLQNGYHFQYLRGIEPAISAVPDLIQHFPEERKAILLLVLSFLLKADPQTMVYMTGMMEILWQKFPVEADTLFKRYLKVRGRYDEYIQELRKKQKNYYPRFSHQKLVDKAIKAVRDFDSGDLCIEEEDWTRMTAESLPVFFTLLPDVLTEDLLEGVKSALKRFMPEYCDRKRRIEFRSLLIWKYADLLFSVSDLEVKPLLQPFKENLDDSCFSREILQRLIWVSIQRNDESRLWLIWEELYPAMLKLDRRDSGLMSAYLFDGINGKANQGKTWEMLNVRHYSFFENLVRDLPYPPVLLCLLKLVNGIGEQMTDVAIEWVYGILSSENFSGRYSDDCENLIFHLETYMDRYVRTAKIQIKRDVHLKAKVLVILDFLIQHNSRIGFSLKDVIV